LEAFALAREDGADGVELDVHRSVDGGLVVHHDAAVEGLGILAEQTLEHIRAVHPWIPTLAEVLDACTGLLVNVEIKNSPGDEDFDPDEGVAAAAVELLASRGRTDDVLVSSFHLPTIERVHRLDPALPTGYLMVFDPGPLDAVGSALTGGHHAIHPFFGVLADRAAVTVVEAAHTVGIAVNAWTVDEPEEMVRLAAAGVDAIVTDVPGLARATLGRG